MHNELNLIHPIWAAPGNVRALFTTRVGGFSSGSYEGLNLSFKVGDNPQRVIQNREQLDAQLPSTPKWVRQVHGTHVCDAESSDEQSEADGIVTSTPDIVCGIMTADCLAILMCDSLGQRVAAIHAGWRGLHHGIIERAVRQFDGLQSDIYAVIGPSISQKHYEVDHDFFERFVQKNSRYERCFLRGHEKKYFANLQEIAAIQLTEHGVRDIANTNLCTYTHSDRFYSHRREQPTGRTGALIWMSHS